MRITFAEALTRGWIKPEDVPSSRPGRDGSRAKPRAKGAPSTLRNGKTPGQRAAEKNAPAPRLWEALKHLEGAEQEYLGAVPNRRFKLDVAFPQEKLCIEIDGWEWHGKHKGDFQRDRERQNLLTLHGWRILRFTAKDVREDIEACVTMVRMSLRAKAG